MALLVLGLIVGIYFRSFATLACDVDFLGVVLKVMTLLGEGLPAFTFTLRIPRFKYHVCLFEHSLP